MPTIEESRTVETRVEPMRLLGTAPSAAFAPAGPSGEREFLAERLALFARVACLASSGFLLMRIVLNAVAQRSARGAPLEAFPVFHLVATLILLFLWILAGGRSASASSILSETSRLAIDRT